MWPPDYDSGWVSYSTASGDRAKCHEHKLGREPSLMMLYLSQNTGTTGWVIAAMSSSTRGYNIGTAVHDVTENWALVKGGRANIAQLFSDAGVSTAPTAGYQRFMPGAEPTVRQAASVRLPP